MSTPRLTGIELEGFRGFGELKEISLDADVVLIRGDNGSGKTSLVDGLLWVFTGELAHLALRVKGLRKTEDPVVNRYTGPPARVRLSIAVDDVTWEFERRGTADSNQLVGWRES